MGEKGELLKYSQVLVQNTQSRKGFAGPNGPLVMGTHRRLNLVVHSRGPVLGSSQAQRVAGRNPS